MACIANDDAGSFCQTPHHQPSILPFPFSWWGNVYVEINIPSAAEKPKVPVVRLTVPGQNIPWLKCCFTSTETVGLLGTGAQDVLLDGFHTAPEL